MKFRIVPETTLKSWTLRLLIGPAGFVDASAETLTAAYFNPNLKLRVIKKLVQSRIKPFTCQENWIKILQRKH